MGPRIPLAVERDLSADIRETLSVLPPLNAFRMIANAPASFQGFVQLAGSILFGSDLNPRSREVAILRVAHMTACKYEWSHHVTAGKMVGITDDEIAKIGVSGTVTDLDEEANLVCRVA